MATLYDLDDLRDHLTRVDNTEWMEQAACRGIDPAVFFVDRGGSSVAAKDACNNCPVTGQCLAHAIANGEHHGIWGGTTGRERVKLRRRLGVLIARPIHHGTRSGYLTHQRRGEVPCGPCTIASSIWLRERYQQSKSA